MASPGTHFGVMLYMYKSNCEDFRQPPGAECVWCKGELGVVTITGGSIPTHGNSNPAIMQTELLRY